MQDLYPSQSTEEELGPQVLQSWRGEGSRLGCPCRMMPWWPGLDFFLPSFRKATAGKLLPQGPKRSESIPMSGPGSHGAAEKDSDDQVSPWDQELPSGTLAGLPASLPLLTQPFSPAGHR